MGWLQRRNLIGFLSTEWRFCPNATAMALPMVNSDHSPIILYLAPNSTSGRRFKFEAMWQEHPEFENVLANSWNSSSNSEDSMAAIF